LLRATHVNAGPAYGDEEGAADPLIVAEAPSAALGAKCDQTMLNAAFDAVLLDCKVADAGEIDCLVIGVAAPAERVEVLGASPPLEDIDPRRVQRIRRHREVETARCLAGKADSPNTCHDMGVSVRWIEDEVTGHDEHPPIVTTRGHR
jgi:hypothetical protein